MILKYLESIILNVLFGIVDYGGYHFSGILTNYNIHAQETPWLINALKNVQIVEKTQYEIMMISFVSSLN
jgi:hypothetical protein